MKLIKSKKFFKQKSCVEFLIKGYNIERMLNDLAKRGVEFFEVEKIDAKNARVQVKVRNRKFVKKYLKERQFEIISEKFLGLSYILHFLKSRWGLILGTAIAAVLFLFMNTFLLGFRIDGVSAELQNEIVEVLGQNGISVLKPIGGVKTDEVEKIILENFESVSLASAVKKGSCILINIKEKLKTDEVGGFVPLLATQNGLITEINLIQGTLLVKVGDIVRVGDPLVAPYTFDSNGNQIPIVPKAEVIADIWLTGESEHSEVETKIERTGKVVKFRESSFLGQTIFSNNGEIPFESYDIVEKISYLTDFILPIKYRETFYFETKCDIIEVSFEEVREKKVAEAKQKAYLQISDTSKIKAEDYSISSGNGKWVVVYTITLSGDIAV